MSLSVKVFYKKNGQGDPEIRRFAVDHDVSSNYEYLSRKVMQALPDLQQKKFSLQWKDSDGDFVTFSSDEELVEALGCLQESVFKVFVKVEEGSEQTRDKSPSGNSPGPQVHPGVECDGCAGSVTGTRFKCVVCPDYDLCASCEAKGMHTEHQMMRINSPQMGFQGPWGFMGMHAAFSPPPPPPPPHGHPPPPPHHGHPPPPPHHGHPPPPPHGHGHPPPPPHHGPWGNNAPWDPRAIPPQWRDWMKKCRSNLMGWGNPFGEAEDASGQDMETEDDQASSGKKEKGKAEKGDGGFTHDDYLKAVGNHVAAMLDPLGIDVSVDVEHGSQRRRCGSKKGKGHGKSTSDNKSSQDQSKSNEDKKDDKAGTSVDVDMAEAPNKPETPKPTTTQNEAAKSAKPKGEPLDDWTMLGSQINLPPPSAPTMTPQTSPPTPVTSIPLPPPSSIPTPVSTAASAAPVSPPGPSVAPGQGIYPNLTPAPAPRATHPDPRIAGALEQMIGMGFHDEGGWLTHLLVAKQGNISAVLDAMRPSK